MPNQPANRAAIAQQPMVAEPLEDTQLLRFPGWERFDRLSHVVTTQPWNMAPHRGAQADLAIERRQRICGHLGISFERLTAPDQIHSGHVLSIRASDIGCGRLGRDSAVKFVDGLVTDMVDTPILQLSGDCPLILVYDPVTQAIGTAHASWRGTVAAVAMQLVHRMAHDFNCLPSEMFAAIAPCAGSCEYEIGDDVRRVIAAQLPGGEQFVTPLGERWALDLKSANAFQLIQCGVPAGNVTVAAESTLSDERFYSHRRNGADAGRFALIAALRP